VSIFVAAFRELIASTVVDPASSCEAACHRAGLERIAATVGAVNYISFCNLANVNEAMRGVLLDLLGGAGDVRWSRSQTGLCGCLSIPR
jgi:hypothetical protein